jgi:dipeptidyl aminopeptidase/acylaminoacyl peptidase
MDSLKEPLDREVEGLPISSEALAKTIARARRRSRNKRIAAGVVGIGVFVAAVWIVTSGLSFDRSETPAATGPAETGPAETRPTALEPTEAIGPVPETDYLLDLNTGEMTPLPGSIVAHDNYPGMIDGASGYAASPDGSRLAYALPGDNGKQQIFVASLDGTDIEQVSHDVEAASSPVWSPDGSEIAYVGQQGDEPGNVFVLDLATGTSTQLTFSSLEPDRASPDVGPLSFTPDGSSIVYSVYLSEDLAEGRAPRGYEAVVNELSVIVWFRPPPLAMARISNLYSVPGFRNSGGTVTEVTDGGRSTLNTRSGSGSSTITW